MALRQLVWNRIGSILPEPLQAKNGLAGPTDCLSTLYCYYWQTFERLLLAFPPSTRLAIWSSYRPDFILQSPWAEGDPKALGYEPIHDFETPFAYVVFERSGLHVALEDLVLKDSALNESSPETKAESRP